ncbi:MAG TPA: hypothetical protein VMI33_23440 [Streptosporangiaceae bacterium]|nr:hypothetical protein [Streptosporangiaceae bacterium]
MDQRAREDIAAAAAVRRDLGRDYDAALAESLVERIGAEIDKRVDMRLGRAGELPVPRTRPGARGRMARSPGETIVLALGSMAIGGITANAVLNSHGNGSVVALIWLVIGVINVGYARRR